MQQDHFVTLKTFDYPYEAAVIVGKLESEGIACFLKDELSIQTHNFTSQALGGVKLQVSETDAKKAIAILTDLGFLSTTEKQHSPIVKWFQNFTDNIPYLKKQPVIIRLVMLVAFALGLISAILISLIEDESKVNEIARISWCVDYIVFKGDKYLPQTFVPTNEIFVSFSGCEEQLDLDTTNHSIELPGFKSEKINAQWTFENGELIIHHASNFGNVYNHVYKVKVNSNSLRLKSDSTIIHARALSFDIF